LGEGQNLGGVSSASIIAALPANIQYVWGLRGPSDLVLRDRVATTSGGDLGVNGSGLNERLYALQDDNWNVFALVNTSGMVVERFTYTAFGISTALNPNFTAYTGTTDYHWTYLFGCYNLDPFTGLYKSATRIYDAYLASFTTMDPIPNPNLYWYCSNNPINATDPTGAQVAIRWTWDPSTGAPPFVIKGPAQVGPTDCLTGQPLFPQPPRPNPALSWIHAPALAPVPAPPATASSELNFLLAGAIAWNRSNPGLLSIGHGLNDCGRQSLCLADYLRENFEDNKLLKFWTISVIYGKKYPGHVWGPFDHENAVVLVPIFGKNGLPAYVIDPFKINVPLNYGDFRSWCSKALSKWRRFFSSGFAA
jgi:RHS repeat-associated protein